MVSLASRHGEGDVAPPRLKSLYARRIRATVTSTKRIVASRPNGENRWPFPENQCPKLIKQSILPDPVSIAFLFELDSCFRSGVSWLRQMSCSLLPATVVYRLSSKPHAIARPSIQLSVIVRYNITCSTFLTTGSSKTLCARLKNRRSRQFGRIILEQRLEARFPSVVLCLKSKEVSLFGDGAGEFNFRLGPHRIIACNDNRPFVLVFAFLDGCLDAQDSLAAGGDLSRVGDGSATSAGFDICYVQDLRAGVPDDEIMFYCCPFLRLAEVVGRWAHLD